MPDLTKKDATRWAVCRKVAMDGLNTYWEVGRALLEIKEDKLYRAEFGTFEAYCESELGCNERYANRMVQGAEVFKSLEAESRTNLSENSPAPPQTKSHVAELAKAEPEDRSELWGDAVESAGDGPVTAKHVKAVVEAKANQPPSEPLSKVEQAMADSKAAFLPVLAATRELKKQVKALCASGHAPYLTEQRIVGDIKNVSNALNHAKPWEKCVFCGGMGRKSCKTCKGVGWICKLAYKMAPREMRAALREA